MEDGAVDGALEEPGKPETEDSPLPSATSAPDLMDAPLSFVGLERTVSARQNSAPARAADGEIIVSSSVAGDAETTREVTTVETAGAPSEDEAEAAEVNDDSTDDECTKLLTPRGTAGTPTKPAREATRRETLLASAVGALYGIKRSGTGDPEKDKGIAIRENAERMSTESTKWSKFFEIPDNEKLLDDSFHCALYKKIMHQGRLYIFEGFFCFYSNVFGVVKKRVIAVKDVTIITKARTALVVPNAIEVVMVDGRRDFFTSFVSHDKAYKLMLQAWEKSSPYAHMFINNPAFKKQDSGKSDKIEEARPFAPQLEAKPEPTPAAEADGAGDKPTEKSSSEASQRSSQSATSPDEGEGEEEEGGPHMASSADIPQAAAAAAAAASSSGADGDAASTQRLSAPFRALHGIEAFHAQAISLGEQIFSGLAGAKKGKTALPRSSGYSILSEDEGPDGPGAPSASSSRSGITMTDRTDRRISSSEPPPPAAGAGAPSEAPPAQPQAPPPADIGLPPIHPRRHSRVLSNSSEGFDIPDAMLTGSLVQPSNKLNPLILMPGAETPWPTTMKKVATVELPATIEEFFTTCFSDGASVTFTKMVHENRGDTEVHVTNWSTNSPAGFARDVTFRAPIKGMSFGPKSTYCHQTQQCRRYSQDTLTLQTCQVMTDIPYGDYFRVEQRWDVKTIPGGRTALTVGVDVPFSKSTFLKGTIESSTFTETTEVITGWIEQARRALAKKTPSTVKRASSRPTEKRHSNAGDAGARASPVSTIRERERSGGVGPERSRSGTGVAVSGRTPRIARKGERSWERQSQSLRVSDTGASVSEGLGLLGSLTTLQRVGICLLALLAGAVVVALLQRLQGSVKGTFGLAPKEHGVVGMGHDSGHAGAPGGWPHGVADGSVGETVWAGEGIDTHHRWAERVRVLREEALFLERRLAYVRGELGYAEGAAAARRNAAIASAQQQQLLNPHQQHHENGL